MEDEEEKEEEEEARQAKGPRYSPDGTTLVNTHEKTVKSNTSSSTWENQSITIEPIKDFSLPLVEVSRNVRWIERV